MFRRTKPETSATPVASSAVAGSTATGTPAGKGRPTPSRKQAEAEAKARAKPPRTRKEQLAASRGARGAQGQSSAQIRAAMRSGDERYLPVRDKGPVRRFVRDFVDARLSIVELMIPVLVVTMVLGYTRQPTLVRIGNTVLLVAVLFMIADVLWLRFRLRRQLAERFPDASAKGTTYYALVRALQLRFMRLPKAQVKIGAELPEHYR